jgi:uncharacterized membrane protein (DUF2068 family)
MIKEANGSAVDRAEHVAGLRTVATFEAAKGLLVLAGGLGLLTLLGKDIHEAAEKLLRTVHLNPEGHLSQIFLRAADKVSDGKLWVAAGGTVVYAAVRWTEAWGLWHAREWAEWFALLSGSLYLPWEIYEILEHPGPIPWLILATNLTIIFYMAYIRLQAARR